MRKGLSKDIIIKILGRAPKYTLLELENKYPERNSEGFITRFAPSPTGFMHIGGLYQSLINCKLAKQSNGIFMLRIEDTDSKREIKEATKIIYDSLNRFNLSYQNFEEYGPYIQSERIDVYISVISSLLEQGKAYPCFLNKDEIEDIKQEQEKIGMPTGIYGNFAKYRDITEQEINEMLNKGIVPAIRLYNEASINNKIVCRDLVRGNINISENINDEILLKSNDRLPTYHFAHICDDHYMRTTHVIRGEEWLPSFPLHIQLFKMMNWKIPNYIHTSTIDKIDEETNKQRKLSKRKDKESNVMFFVSEGYPNESVLEYLFNILSSKYEENKIKGLVKNIWDMDINVKKIPTSPALFDIQKLNWWSKEYISTLNTEDLTNRICSYVKEFCCEDWKERIKDKSYLFNILNIEREDLKKIRKDFITYKQTLNEISFFFDDLYEINKNFIFNKKLLKDFLITFNINDDKNDWWNKIIEISKLNNVKNGEAAMNLRVALSGRTNSPDLYSIIKVMGKDKILKRINLVLECL